MTDDPLITSRALIQAGMCFSGQKAWFEQRGLDFKDFVKNGLPCSAVESLGDALANKAIAIAKGTTK